MFVCLNLLAVLVDSITLIVNLATNSVTMQFISCYVSSWSPDENSLKEDGPYSCVHCGLPQHSKESRTQKPSL